MSAPNAPDAPKIRPDGWSRKEVRERALVYVQTHAGCQSAEVSASLKIGRSTSLGALQWLRAQGAIEVRGARRTAGWHPTRGDFAPPPRARIGPAKAAQIRRVWLLRTRPTLAEGDVAVLSAMAGDLTVAEWAVTLGCAPVDVERACVWLGVTTKEAA